MRRQAYCCDCGDDLSTTELTSEGKAAFLKAIDAAEILRRAVPAWAVSDVDWLIADLEKVAGELGVESAAATAFKKAAKERENREKERAWAKREREQYERTAAVLGIAIEPLSAGLTP